MIITSNTSYHILYICLRTPAFYKTDGRIPNCWRTIEAGVNDKLYYNIGNIPIIHDPEGSFVSGTDWIATMPPGYYTEQEFTNALNTVIHRDNPSLTCSFNDTTKTMSITLDPNVATTK